MKKGILFFTFLLFFSCQVQTNPRSSPHIILFIGDGMGVDPITLARLTYGKVSLDAFPHTALVKTYCLDNSVTDSAAAATAMATGFKTVRGAIAMVPKNGRWHSLPTLMEFLRDKQGYAIGVVTTTRLTHATPAAFLTHVPKRHMEQEIAKQLSRSRAHVLLGGGRKYFFVKKGFLPLKQEDIALLDQGKVNATLSKLLASKDITVIPHHKGKLWQIQQKNTAYLLYKSHRFELYQFTPWALQMSQKGYTFVFDRQGLQKAPLSRPLVGLFHPSHMSYAIDKRGKEPTLREMVQKAIEILEQTNRPFFLLVEGGRIDHAEHSHDATTLAQEVKAFSEAVAFATQWARKNPNTLLLVTADHNTGNLGISKTFDKERFRKYLSQSPPSAEALTRKVLQKVPLKTVLKEAGLSNLTPKELSLLQAKKSYYSLMKTLGHLRSLRFGLYFYPLEFYGSVSPEHTGEDVPLYAFGKGAKEFRGVIDNTEIAKKIAKIIGISFPKVVLEKREKP